VPPRQKPPTAGQKLKVVQDELDALKRGVAELWEQVLSEEEVCSSTQNRVNEGLRELGIETPTVINGAFILTLTVSGLQPGDGDIGTIYLDRAPVIDRLTEVLEGVEIELPNKRWQGLQGYGEASGTHTVTIMSAEDDSLVSDFEIQLED